MNYVWEIQKFPANSRFGFEGFAVQVLRDGGGGVSEIILGITGNDI